jgi:hypothetical protein
MRPEIAELLSRLGAWFEPVIMGCAIVLSFLLVLAAHRLL